jgi:hypothetical protein
VKRNISNLIISKLIKNCDDVSKEIIIFIIWNQFLNLFIKNNSNYTINVYSCVNAIKLIRIILLISSENISLNILNDINNILIIDNNILRMNRFQINNLELLLSSLPLNKLSYYSNNMNKLKNIFQFCINKIELLAKDVNNNSINSYSIIGCLVSFLISLSNNNDEKRNEDLYKLVLNYSSNIIIGTLFMKWINIFSDQLKNMINDLYTKSLQDQISLNELIINKIMALINILKKLIKTLKSHKIPKAVQLILLCLFHNISKTIHVLLSNINNTKNHKLENSIGMCLITMDEIFGIVIINNSNLSDNIGFNVIIINNCK